MPDPVESPKEKEPIPSSAGGLIAYGVRQFLSMTAEKSQVLILCALVGWFVWQSWDAQQKQQARDDERYAQDRRDKIELEVRAEQGKLENTKMVLTHCAAQEKIRRDDSLTHMNEAFKELDKLRQSIVIFAAELAKLKKPVVFEDETIPKGP